MARYHRNAWHGITEISNMAKVDFMKNEKKGLEKLEIEYDLVKLEIEKIQRRYNNLKDMREEGEIDGNEYKRRKSKIDLLLVNAEAKQDQLLSEIQNINKKLKPESLDREDMFSMIKKLYNRITISPQDNDTRLSKLFGQKDTLIRVTLESNYIKKDYFIISRFTNHLLDSSYIIHRYYRKDKGGSVRLTKL